MPERHLGGTVLGMNMALENGELQAQNAELQRESADVQGRIHDLNEYMGKNPQNPSNSPSSDRLNRKNYRRSESGRSSFEASRLSEDFVGVLCTHRYGACH